MNSLDVYTSRRPLTVGIHVVIGLVHVLVLARIHVAMHVGICIRRTRRLAG